MGSSPTSSIHGDSLADTERFTADAPNVGLFLRTQISFDLRRMHSSLNLTSMLLNFVLFVMLSRQFGRVV